MKKHKKHIKMKLHIIIITSISLVILSCTQNQVFAQNDINYEESKVPNFILPELFICNNGEKVVTVEQWEQQRRPEILELFLSQVYGRTPKSKIAVTYEMLSENQDDLGGKAISKQVKFTFTNGTKSIVAFLLIYLPKQAKGKVPVIISYNYKGNHSTISDTTILYSPSLSLVKEPGNPDWIRGCQSYRWPFNKIIERGYGVATMCYHDIFPDEIGLKDHSVVSLFPNYNPDSNKIDEWQAIGAWAWGLSRIMDYIETQAWVDLDKIVLMGHSRQGKAALWAGAQDARFRIVISNNSGSGGAALSKRVFGENIAYLTAITPKWFCPAFDQYANNEVSLTFDQHELIALMAPRPVYIASAKEDLWADPKGEFLSAYYSGSVYELYGLSGLGTSIMPAIHQPIMNDVGYHIRAGKHDVTDYDWKCFMDFADQHFYRKLNDANK